ncbi:PTS system galactose-specific transporter subunit IIB [Streptococcus pneumoniae]|nr:PTS system galactose-specific transporter subunit IIB [Streptococcus pneumoniae]COF76178.1 PTS system galactose-specific transporter subunit IIB [Streptococcus pneumoniae]
MIKILAACGAGVNSSHQIKSALEEELSNRGYDVHCDAVMVKDVNEDLMKGYDIFTPIAATDLGFEPGIPVIEAGLTSSVLSTTSKQCFEQPAASFLVCSLVFIEYNTLLEVGLNFLISLFTFTFDILYPIVKVGHTDDYSHGAVKLSVSLVDKDAMKKISVTVIGYFEINIDENITDILYVNGTAILYPYLRSIVSIVSAIDSSEAMLLPTINVLELLDKSQPFEEE